MLGCHTDSAGTFNQSFVMMDYPLESMALYA
jgi:hypothetical protein